MKQVLKWVAEGVGALALPAASVALMAYGVYLTLVP